MHNNSNVNELIKILWTCRQEWKDIKAAEGLTEGTDYAYVTNTDEFTAADVEGMDYLVGTYTFFLPRPYVYVCTLYMYTVTSVWLQWRNSECACTRFVFEHFLCHMLLHFPRSFWAESHAVRPWPSARPVWRATSRRHGANCHRDLEQGRRWVLPLRRGLVTRSFL